jgi:hypothetical protein
MADPFIGTAQNRAGQREACASPYGDGFQPGKRAPSHHENLGNHTCKHHSRPAGTDKRPCDRRPAGRSDTQNPIAQRLPTAGSCMRGFRTPDGTRNPSPSRSFDAVHDNPKAAFSSYGQWSNRRTCSVCIVSRRRPELILLRYRRTATISELSFNVASWRECRHTGPTHHGPGETPGGSSGRRSARPRKTSMLTTQPAQLSGLAMLCENLSYAAIIHPSGLVRQSHA